MALSPRQQEIKDEFIRVRGTWSDTWQAILELDPEFLKAYADFSAVPWRKNHLDDKVKEFIYIAIDAAATHMYLPGVRQHIKAALKRWILDPQQVKPGTAMPDLNLDAETARAIAQFLFTRK